MEIDEYKQQPAKTGLDTRPKFDDLPYEERKRIIEEIAQGTEQLKIDLARIRARENK
jgi:acyl-CoA reductase-like NAD-dependent aldehyde dehydrogenase